MKYIKLTQKKYAIVDNEDYPLLNLHKWCAIHQRNTDGFYAVRHMENNHKKMIRMHRIIMNCPINKEIDHINHNTLDNRKENLRIVTVNQNQQNAIKHKSLSSKYKGVCWDKRNKKWLVQIIYNNKRIFSKRFVDEIDAKNAYNKKAKELFGEYFHV